MPASPVPPAPPRRFIVTGANGFVGAAVTRALRAQGEVLAVDQVWSPAAEVAEPRTTLSLVHPIPDAPELREVVIVHAAGRDEDADRQALWDANVVTTFNVADWALRHQARHLVVVSSGGVYQPQTGRRLDESSPVDPRSFAAHTRYLAEAAATAFQRSCGLPVSIARLFAPYVPNAVAGLAMRRDAESLWRGPAAARSTTVRVSPIHVDDAAQAIAAIAIRAEDPQIYNVCGDDAVTLAELAAACRAPDAALATLAGTSDASGDWVGDNGKLKLRTGWAPRRRWPPIRDAAG